MRRDALRLLPRIGVIGIVQIGDQGDAGVQMNIAIHAFGIAAVLALVLVPIVHMREWTQGDSNP